MGNYWHQANCTYPIAPIEWNMGMWYLVVEYFCEYLNKCGNKEHCHGVEMSPKTCYHHILTSISNLFQHYILPLHGSAFGTRAMCLFEFLCFNGVCGFLHVSNILVDFMFQVYVSVMFLYKAYVYLSRPCFSINQIHVYV